jgi:hypothetical protein
MASRAGFRVQPLAAIGVRHLIVVLRERDEPHGWQVERGRAATVFLPSVPLALIQETVFHGRHELLRSASVPGVVGLGAPRGGDHGAVVKIVVPERVEAVAALLARSHEPSQLSLVLTDHDRAARGRGAAHRLDDFFENVRGGLVEDLLRGVETQSVQMELLDPVPRVADEELAHRAGPCAVEIDGVAPLGRPFREV